MDKDERYEVDSKGQLVIGKPQNLTTNERKDLFSKMFSINGWSYTVLNEISGSHFHIKLENSNLGVSKTFHLYHGNVRKEDPDRNREEKKIQLGTENDPREFKENAIILGVYVYENKQDYRDAIIVAWPIEEEKNYPANPSLRVNMRTDVIPAKNTGYYVDSVTGKNLVVFRPEFIYHYIENYKELHYSAPIHPGSMEEESDISEDERIAKGTNILLYGVPGSGKSWTIEHEYCKKDTKVERLVFHPDYTYADFVGQILPAVDDNGQVSYKFTAGPFTNILKDAYENPKEEYILVIEEINRGNAPAIFGDVFQLLDRKIEIGEDQFPIGTSAYGITNANIAGIVYNDAARKVRIPSNLSIIGTMNTSDQNVFTLDTAFQRRWQMRLIENNFENVRDSLANAQILDTGVTWKKFCSVINKIIVGNKVKMASAEDKRLGVYFVHENDLRFNQKAASDTGLKKEYNSLLKAERDNTISADDKQRLEDIREALMQNRIFPAKVIKYLWDDAFKFNPEAVFDTSRFESLEDIIATFLYSAGSSRLNVFNKTVRDLLTQPA